MTCPQCQKIIDNTPCGVLLRAGDEIGDGTDLDRPVICRMCQAYIWRNNNQVRDGHRSFVFENPNANGVPSVESSSKTTVCPANHHAGAISPPRHTAHQSRRWLCKRCGCRVWSAARAFEGAVEPEDWWWCRQCQQTQDRKKTARRKRGGGSIETQDTHKTHDIRQFFEHRASDTHTNTQSRVK
jgi:hypothetical protein